MNKNDEIKSEAELEEIADRIIEERFDFTVKLGIFNKKVDTVFGDFLKWWARTDITSHDRNGRIENLKLELQDIADSYFPGMIKIGVGIDPIDGNPFIRFMSPEMDLSEAERYSDMAKKRKLDASMKTGARKKKKQKKRSSKKKRKR
jgi:hypothetical protein